MKKILHPTFLALAAALMAPAAVSADNWGTIDNPATVYTLVKKNGNNMEQLQSVRGKDGKIWISWIQYGVDAAPGWGFEVHLQLLDVDGTPLLDENGVIIEDKCQTSGMGEYYLTVADNGDAIVGWSDSRGQEEMAKYERDKNIPVIYRVNQQGEHVWGADGITFDEVAYINPPCVHCFGGEIFAILFKNNETQSGCDIVRLNEDGTMAFDPKPFSGQCVESLNGDFIAVGGGEGGTIATRYNRDCEPVWDQPAIVSSYIYGGFVRYPYRLVPDTEGGVVVSFQRELGSFSHIPVVNHISASGEATFGNSVDVIDTEMNEHSFDIVGVNPRTQEIFTAWAMSSGVLKFAGQCMDYYGERLWGDLGVILEEKDPSLIHGYGPMAAFPLTDDNWFVAWVDMSSTLTHTAYFSRFNREGEELSRDQITDGEVGIALYDYFQDDNVITAIYLDHVYDRETYTTTRYIRTIRYEAETSGIENVATDNAVAGVTGEAEYYSINGVRLDRPQQGINIVRNGDGSVSKVVVK